MRQQVIAIDRTRIAEDEEGKPAVFGTVLAGTPREIHRNLFDDATGRFSCGVWQCTPGLVAMKDWPYDEFCVLLTGRVTITPEGGEPRDYAAGDALVLPRGFTGTWEIRETVRKYYAVQRRPSALARIKAPVRRLLGLLGLRPRLKPGSAF